MLRRLATCFLATIIAAGAACAAEAPRLVRIAPIAPDILALEINQQRVEYGDQVPYTPAPGDKEEKWGDYAKWGWVKRDGKVIGARIDPRGDLLQQFDRLVGDPLDLAWADKPASYRITSPDDPAYAAPTSPVAVWRKSKPVDVARTAAWGWASPAHHVLYLHFPARLQEGKLYRLTFEGGPLPATEYHCQPGQQRSEAVHVSQVGFRPDDPVKVAFLSCWLGTGGPHTYPAGLPFRVLDDRDGNVVFTGKAVMARAASEPEDVYNRNYNGVDVHRLDFSDLKSPGRYRVYVEGVGCSYPFTIGPAVWADAFRTSARGFYHQRSGIALGPPYTVYRRPRCFNPEDGLQVFQSTCSLMDSGNGLNAKGTDKDNFGNLVAGKTDQIVPNAWGGYCDAGDWDRRIQHLDATRLLLELTELCPDLVREAALNIPESGGPVPDLVAEAQWNVDFYRRLQMPDGAIRGGIESAEHPQFGEGSWEESLPVMCYAPDCWSTYTYAGVAARIAFVLGRLGKGTPATYRDSALRAMAWAEANYAALDRAKLPTEVRDVRNLAAAELYRLTGEARWNDIFRATTAFSDPRAEPYEWKKHDQRDAAFIYARLDRPDTDPTLRSNCRNAVLRSGDMTIACTGKTAFGWGKTMNLFQPPSWGGLTAPQAVNLVRSHVLTGGLEYLRAAVRACQFGAGANPVNMCYTTGVGTYSPQHPLVVDMRVSHESPPPGITILGPSDTQGTENYWLLKLLRTSFAPAPEKWPTTEAYFDVYMYPQLNEFTVNQTMGPNAYVWGYLAGRK
jgi:endoglucanase